MITLDKTRRLNPDITIGELKKFIEDNKIPDDATILIEGIAINATSANIIGWDENEKALRIV